MHKDRVQLIVLNASSNNYAVKYAPPLITLVLFISPGLSHAALVSPCAGVSLPPSVVTNIVGAAVLPLTGTLDSTLSILLGPLGLNSNLNNTLTSIAAGNPINLNVLDTNGNVVSPAAQCDTSSDSYTLDTPKGISIGGNQITGLGNGIVADAGELNSIAFGNNAVTNAAALNSIAIGTNAAVNAAGTNSIAIGNNATVNVGNSIAIGANSTATTGAESNYTAFALPSSQNSVGEVSVGSSGNERKITNVAAGSNATDAVNVAQLQALDDNVVKYDPLSLKMTVTLGGPLSNDGGLTNGTKVTNLSQGALNATSTDAVNGAQLFSTNTNLNNVGLNTANHLGGGATYDPSTGAISSPSYNVYGTNYNNVGTALGALQSSAPIQYSDNNGVPTPGTVSNDTVLVGSTNAPVTLHNVAAGTAATDAVNVSQLQALDGDAVKYDPLSLKMTVTLGGPLSNDGGATGGTRITNLSQANLSANSTDAVNGAQLFSTNTHIDAIGVNTANHLGGGATYDPSTGIISTPSYSVYGANYNSVGTAIGALQSSAPVQYSDSNGVPTPNNVGNDVTLVGSTNTPVTLHNVAAGSAATDAVNVSQLQAVSNDVSTLDSLAVKYSDPTKALISLGGPTSTDGGITGGTLITNLQQGQVSATSTDAVNGAQLFNLGAGLTSNIDALGNSTANNFGGGAVYNPLTGIISAPSYSVFGTSYNNVGSAISALQSSAPLQYSDNNGVITPNTVTNDVTLQGSGGGPVTIHNVAAGSAPNDAVNVSQLNAVANNVSTLDSLAVKYADPTKALITLGGPTSTDGGVTGGTLITNLQQGQISANSTDAVNGAQLYTTVDMINHINNSAAIKFFNVNSTLGDSNATGNDSMSIGPLSNATGANSIAMGVNSVASNSGAVAIGQNAEASNVGAIAVGQNAAATGLGSIAIGSGALATGSVAVGTGAQAGNGGAAFGDNAVALTPNQGTAIGNGATVTANRGVALGAGATATRAGMNGATERYSNVPVTSTEGAVSVGSVNNERQITNVAGGTAATDAVNVRQLDAAMAQTSIDIGNQLDNLRSDLISFKDDANAGTAAAMAIASMPQSVIPGKVLMAAGIANYQGQSAVSIGVSNFSENGRWILNVNGSANTRGNAGAAVGIGFHW